MEQWILIGIQIVLGCFEIWLCYELFHATLLDQRELGRKRKLLKWVNIIILGVLLAINRNLAFFSGSMHLFSIITTSFYVWVLSRKDILLIFGVSTLFFSLVALIDFLVAFSSMAVLGNNYVFDVYFEHTLWQVSIFLVTRVILGAVLLFLINKKLLENRILTECKNIVIFISIILYYVLKGYHGIFVYIIFNEMEVQAEKIIAYSFSLITIMTVIIFIIGLSLKYKMFKNRTEYILKYDEIERQRYQELLKNHEKTDLLVHDVKNHFVVLHELSKSGEIERIHQYLEDLQMDFLESPFTIWTGNKVLDFLLNQKKVIAEKEDIKISFQVEWMPEMKLSESEICALFGNLLDNAIEACESILHKDRWITVCLKKKQSLLYIEILNGCSREIDKGGKLKTTKSNKEKHGYGLKSVHRIVDKYEGVIDYSIKDNIFQINLTFFDL